MTKLNKIYYYSKKGERKINCYSLHIPKKILELSGINENDNVKIRIDLANRGRILIEKD